jgi:hypothetical protein
MSIETYEQVRKIVEPMLEHFHDDLLKHDYQALKEYDGPFVYGYRPTGTDLLLMRPHVDDYSWRRPITIAEIDASLQRSFIWIDYQSRNTHFLHFDGNKLFRRSAQDLKEIWFDHVAKIVNRAIHRRFPDKRE